ncbi:hypothetical protein [Sulfurimonas sp. CS5]|uniref:hypothetical protein n=1 Tax=Sulfurimonas sp. CS5 TaxID=3391145 RepID=UPI0039E98C26
MKIQLNHKTNDESNLYLRALWASLRKSYGKCAWQFMPYKDGKSKTVHIGFMDIGLGNTVEVSIQYEKKGVIKFLDFNSELPEHEIQIIHDLCLSIDVNNLQKDFVISTVLNTGVGNFSSTLGKGYRIFLTDTRENILEISVTAFDVHDAGFIAGNKIQSICDLLSVFINSYVKMGSLTCLNEFTNISVDTIYSENLDWIDDHPREGDFLVLANYQKLIIENLLLENIHEAFLNGASHFNNAAYLLKDFSFSHDATVDTAVVLYVSSLESCAAIQEVEKKSCKECGQVKYSIRRRVLDLVGDYLPNHLVKFIDDYYASRSKYLHEGRSSSKNIYFGTSLPQLDPYSSSGCKIQTSIMPINLRDYVSYIFRKIAQEGIFKS